MPAAFGTRLGAAATVVVACSCTALLGLDGKHYGSGGGGAGGSSGAAGAASSSSTTSSGVGPGGAAATSSSSGAGGAPACPGADVMTDRLNCGRCNHDCLGGACVAGACQPVAVAVTQGILFPDLLAIDANWVYWVIQQGSTYEILFRGVHDLPNATTGSLGSVDGITALAAAGGYVGWTTSTPVDGGSAAAASALQAQGSPIPISLYQGTGFIGPMLGHGPYFSFANPAGLVTVVPSGMPIVAVGPNIGSIAADSGHVYWLVYTGDLVAGDQLGMGGKTLLTDVGARYLATSNGDPNLYWILQAGLDGSIRMAPKTGGTAITIGNPTLIAMSVAVDAEAVYVASIPSSCPGTPNGRIQRIDLKTHQETLLPGTVCPFAVVADDVCIYWTDPNGGGLVRLAK
jgi:hypothetical protein